MQGRALGPHKVFIFLRALSFLTSVPGGGLASTEVQAHALSFCPTSLSQPEEKGRDLSKLGGWSGVCRTLWVGLSILRSEVKGRDPR